MSEQIKIQTDEFETVTASMKSSAGNISSSMKTNQTLDRTNIDPFIKGLEHTIQAIGLLENYKSLLTSDVTILKDTGRTIQETDAKIAQETSKVTN